MRSALLLAVAIPNNIDTPQFGEDLYHQRRVLWRKRHATKRDKTHSDETGAYKFQSKEWGDNFQVHFGWTATPQNSNNAEYFHLALKDGAGAFVPIRPGSDLTNMEVKRLPLPYKRAATTDERTRPIIDQIVGRVAPHVQALIKEHFPDVYKRMQNNAKDYRYPSEDSIFTGGTISFMFAKNTGQPVRWHKDDKDAKGTVGVSINQTVGEVEGGNLVIDILGRETLTVPANHAAVAAFKDLSHVVNAPTGGRDEYKFGIFRVRR